MPAIHRRILALNQENSVQYVAAEAARLRYRAMHPTRLAAVKCMDGRVLFPNLTQTPMGLVQPFRAIGGRPEVWWPSFLGRLRAWVEDAMSHGLRCLLFITYHFSASHPDLGCAGWAYDTKAARTHAERLARNLTFVFGEQLDVVVAGVETDRDELVLHGESSDLSGSKLFEKDDQSVRAELARVFPELASGTVRDLVPLMQGNARRVHELTATPRDEKSKAHNERILALGQGFDWLYEANLALIINDTDPDLARAIGVAASILAQNLETAAPLDDATLLTCVPYSDPGIDQRQAMARARGLREFALSVVRAEHPQLLASGRLHALSGVLWAPARRFEPLEG